MASDLEQLFEATRLRYRGEKNTCNRVSLEAHLRSLAGQMESSVGDVQVPSYPSKIQIVFAS